ncbi:MAG: type II toxin-antitoxin system RelE/ParE family toxin [Planctomycetota bacterium]
MQLTFSQLALQDLDRTWIYLAIEAENPDAADRVVLKIRDTILLLPTFPNLGRECLEIQDRIPFLRCITVDGFIVYYRLDGDSVAIGRIVHSRRNREKIMFDWNELDH